MTKIAKRIFYSGHVQGVGFRFSANSIARRYDLTGFVRNCPDGKVEMLVQGSSSDIDDCVTDLSETFSIRTVDCQQIPIDPKCTDFRIAF